MSSVELGRTLYLPIKPADRILMDAIPEGQLVRERDLEQASSGRVRDAQSILIDLSEIRILTVEAADEVIGEWIWNLRHYDKQAPIVAISGQLNILRTVHAALRDSRNVAYALLSEEQLPDGPESDRLVPIGDLTQQDIQDLQRIKNHEQISREKSEGLWKRGLLVHDEDFDSYVYPTIELFN